ncbi:hypothetical protein C0Q70_01547 [Pomacea canaliculata]|uniref:cGMP-dependent protein kinase N-terminal coiled-coil domain-containing protein n=1 Tax=Pomacea canaliculata TaxID=400727 RepID=A0A2T7PZS8_POMCA|nr:hypothetical protein C0Q70_01547 [Pomacea canaliculata]
MGSLQEMEKLLHAKDEKIRELQRLVEEKEEVIQQLVSKLDKFKSVLATDTDTDDHRTPQAASSGHQCRAPGHEVSAGDVGTEVPTVCQVRKSYHMHGWMSLS